jgi:hypothetical protein
LRACALACVRRCGSHPPSRRAPSPCTHARAQKHTYTHMRACVRACVRAQVWLALTCARTRTRARKHTHTQTQTHVCVRACVNVQVWLAPAFAAHPLAVHAFGVDTPATFNASGRIYTRARAHTHTHIESEREMTHHCICSVHLHMTHRRRVRL